MEEQQPASQAVFLLLLAVVLPPAALDAVGVLLDERVISTAYGDVGPLALRQLQDGNLLWIQPYSGLPSRTDPRATLQAAKELDVRRVLNWDEVTAINPLLSRGQPVIVNDYIDFTRHQPHTFFDGERYGAGGQQPMPCPEMAHHLAKALPMAPGAVYLGIDGPRRETAAEARMYRHWGADVLGQNQVPESALAGELQLCYSGLATVTGFAADQNRPAPRGSLRAGLELILSALPHLVALGSAPAACNCADR